MSSFRKYATLDGANAGAKMMIKDPSGKETGDWIMVRGQDSDHFQKANRKMRRTLMNQLEKRGPDFKGSDDYLDFTQSQQTKLQASLAMDWSFEEPFSEKNVEECFRQCPDIASQVDQFAGKREKFVSASSESSELTQSSSSS